MNFRSGWMIAFWNVLSLFEVRCLIIEFALSLRSVLLGFFSRDLFERYVSRVAEKKILQLARRVNCKIQLALSELNYFAKRVTSNWIYFAIIYGSFIYFTMCLWFFICEYFFFYFQEIYSWCVKNGRRAFKISFQPFSNDKRQ